MNSPSTELLFVYGTLQPGGAFHDAIARHVHHHRPGYIEGVLVDVGRYPALLEGAGWVRGTLLEVAPAALKITDRIEHTVAEKEECEYFRIRARVVEDPAGGGEGTSNDLGEAWTYLYAHPTRLAGRPLLKVGVQAGRDVYVWTVGSSNMKAGSWQERLRSLS